MDMDILLFPTAQESLFETLKLMNKFEKINKETIDILNIILSGIKNEIYQRKQTLYIFEDNRNANTYYLSDTSFFSTQNINEIIDFLKYKGYKVTKVFFYKKNTWAYCISW
jgi:hypothetical protein